MCVCDSSSFSEDHNFKTCCYCPDGINLALKCSPKRCGHSPEGLGKVLQVCSVEQLFFIRSLFEYWKENYRNQLCCSLIWPICEVVTHSCSSLSTELTQRGSMQGAARALRGTLCRPVCGCIRSQRSPYNNRDLAALQRQPPACIRPRPSCEGESLYRGWCGREISRVSRGVGMCARREKNSKHALLVKQAIE